MLSRILRTVALTSALLCLGSNVTPVSAGISQAVLSADGSFGVEFGSSGGSGSLKVYKNVSLTGNSGTGGKRSFEMRLKDISELNAAGTEVQKAQGYATDESNWYGPTATALDGVPTQLCTYRNATLNTNHGSGATIEIRAYIFSNAGAVRNGAENISVPANALKLTFDISAWPFLAVNNSLSFQLELKLDEKSRNAGNGRMSNFDNGRQRRMDWGGAALDVVTAAIIDGALTPVSNPVITQNGASTFVTITLPYFSNHVTYDPTVTLGADQLAAAPATAAASALVAALLAATAALMQHQL